MNILNNVVREISRGGIHWANLPEYEDMGSIQKFKRPVIIVSSDLEIKFSSVIKVVCMTTSTTKARIPQHISINSFGYKNLNRDGLALCEQILTIPKDRILDFIDHLTDIDQFKIDKALAMSVQIDRPNSNYEKQLNNLVEEIKEIEGFVNKSLKKGYTMGILNGDLEERKELIEEFNNLCDKANVKFYNVYDYKIFDRKLTTTIKQNSLKIV